MDDQGKGQNGNMSIWWFREKFKKLEGVRLKHGLLEMISQEKFKKISQKIEERKVALQSLLEN